MNMTTKPTREELSGFYLELGMSLKQIASKYLVSPTTIHVWLKEYDIKTKIRGRYAIQIPTKDDLCALYVDGKQTVSDLSRIYNVSKTTVVYWLRHHQIKDETRRDFKGTNALKQDKPTKEILLNLYETKNMSASQIGELYDLSTTTILNLCREYGVKPRTKGKAKILHPTEEELMNDYCVSGLSTNHIAKKYGVSQCMISLRLKKYNIETRSKGRVSTKVPEKEELMKLYNQEQLSLKQIAGKFDVTKQKVISWFKYHNIEHSDSILPIDI
jgi:transposase-like protein